MTSFFILLLHYIVWVRTIQCCGKQYYGDQQNKGQNALSKTGIQKPSNIVFILTDDQDTTMGGLNSMKKAKELIAKKGATFTNMFTTSPLCCPSRSSILTGKYVHNHGVVNNSVSGNCASRRWQKKEETKAFPVLLKQLGYKTFFAGKYLNQYGRKTTGGGRHVPPGWDDWYGLLGNSRYYNYTLSENGENVHHGDDYEKDYLTDVISRKAVSFLTSQSSDNKQPFFMMLSTPACHAPFTPAPQYARTFSNMTAPRGASFDLHAQDKHWLIRAAKHPMSITSLKYIDTTYRNRWRTLLSVDDMIEKIVKTLDKKGLLDNTYIILTSDNGFHLGQFSLPNDKRQMYEFDIRVPFMVRGPGIKVNQIRKEAIVTIDLAPTLVDLAGGHPPSHMDGRSLVPLLRPSAHSSHPWRPAFLVQHQGEHKLHVNSCPQYDHASVSCCFPDCVCEDAANNTYTCLRLLDSKINAVYCQFSDKEKFTEMYNMVSDPDQLVNLASVLPPRLKSYLQRVTARLSACTGQSCNAIREIGHLTRRLQRWLYKRWHIDLWKSSKQPAGK